MDNILPVSNRVCGTCTACCTMLAVPEVENKPGLPCRHGCLRGCLIYEHRPQPCVTYRCLWLRGHFRAVDRPDISRVIVDVHRTPMGSLLMLHEVKPGAADPFIASEQIPNIGQIPFVVVESNGTTCRLMTPGWWAPSLVKKWKEALMGLDVEVLNQGIPQ